MSKVLLTGATGFVGKRLLAALAGHSIRVMSRTKQLDYETVICDFEKNTVPEDSLNDINTVFHLAGLAHDKRSPNKISGLYQKVNVDATVQLAELAVKSGVKRFVFISSVKAGGRPGAGRRPNELEQGEPEGVYGKTKREAELKLLEISKKSNMHLSIIRPSLVYGPNVKGNLKSMLLGIKKGWFPPLPETRNRRSLVHVDDLVRAILLVVDDSRANGEVFIVTDGKSHSTREIYNAMCHVVNRDIPNWSVPKFIFDFAPPLGLRIKHKLDKLLGDECYSSKKLEALGFIAQRTLKEMNETAF
ncbi:NAD-dependent epimerase/dehydratase family protein [PVC group bacterium]|nr:NAD-dependent epimerase/dehydratase family protein [PVC group bacterium]